MNLDENHQWYLEYQIHKNRPGLLGDISSILGMMSVLIVTINGVDLQKRGMILQTDDPEKISLLKKVSKSRKKQGGTLPLEPKTL